jgi:hypothetical protein
MPTLPRQCLVRFADYKQKDEDVNAIYRLLPTDSYFISVAQIMPFSSFST